MRETRCLSFTLNYISDFVNTHAFENLGERDSHRAKQMFNPVLDSF